VIGHLPSSCDMLRLPRLCHKFRCSRYFSNSAVPDDFGLYSVILPQEPFVFGTSHIQPRSVPQHIRRPSYSKSDEGRISLGTHEETKLREAGRLARDVREFAKSLVKVRRGFSKTLILIDFLDWHND